MHPFLTYLYTPFITPQIVTLGTSKTLPTFLSFCFGNNNNNNNAPCMHHVGLIIQLKGQIFQAEKKRTEVVLDWFPPWFYNVVVLLLPIGGIVWDPCIPTRVIVSKHLHRCSVCVLIATHLDQTIKLLSTVIANRWETTNSNSSGPNNQTAFQSTAGVRLCYAFSHLCKLCKNVGPKPFCWAKLACFDLFFSSNFNLQAHILSTALSAFADVMSMWPWTNISHIQVLVFYILSECWWRFS